MDEIHLLCTREYKRNTIHIRLMTYSLPISPLSLSIGFYLICISKLIDRTVPAAAKTHIQRKNRYTGTKGTHRIGYKLNIQQTDNI